MLRGPLMAATGPRRGHALSILHPIGGAKDDARAWRAARNLHDQARAVYDGWSAQQFATALEEDHGVTVKKRSLDGQPGQRVILTADITAALHTRTPESDRSTPSPR